MTDVYLKDFEAFTGNGGTKLAPWMNALRRSAIDRFAEVGFPSPREEDWRFTNIAPIASGTFRRSDGDPYRVTAAHIAPLAYELGGGTLLVFVNGRFVPGLSHQAELPAGVRVKSLREALPADRSFLEHHLGRYARYEKNGFTALNTAFLTDGALIFVPAGVDLPGPIQLLFVTDERDAATVTYPRNLIVVEPNARVAVLENFVSLTEGPHFTNTVTEALVGENGTLEHTRIQRESERGFHIGTTHIRQERDSRVQSYAVSIGGAIARHNLDLSLQGPGIESLLYGLYLGRGQQLVDNHTAILHAQPNCSTREVYKGVLDGASHAVFNGKVYVTPEAQKTDAKQTNRNLLLSDRAKVDTKPQLEIFADDVKCTHGATVGRLDETALFYLESRGIGPALARRILTYAFAAEVLEEIPHESVRRGLEALVMSRLEQRLEA